MFSYLWNKYQSARLSAQYQRKVQESLLRLAEGSGPEFVGEEPDAADWTLVGPGLSVVTDQDRVDARQKARELAARNPHARNVLRLLEVYVVGPGLAVKAVPMEDVRSNATSGGRGSRRAAPADSQRSEAPHEQDAVPLRRLATAADRLWHDFLQANRRHFSYREHARRAWRDGETFLRKFRQSTWPPAVRFLDPESIGEPPGAEGSKGILTHPRDAELPLAYLRIEPETGRLAEQIPADEVLHTKVGADSNQKRGVTIFLPVADALKRFDGWLETELTARKLQASIVLWRKVKGSPGQVASVADASKTGETLYREGAMRREKIRPGTILTTSTGTELEFLQPNTNISDAVSLGRLILLCIAAGEGLPEFMLTSDASNANFASTMVAEAPAVKLFQAEQQFFTAEFDELWRWAMSEAVRLGLLPSDFFRLVRSHWTAPDLVSRDRPKERLADVALVRQGILSPQEVARRDGVDPEVMRGEMGG